MTDTGRYVTSGQADELFKEARAQTKEMINTSAEGLAADIKQNAADIAANKSTIDTHSSEISTLKSTTSELETAVNTNTSDIEELKESVDGLPEEVSGLKTQVSTNTAAIETLNGDSDTEGSVRRIANEVLAEQLAGADEDFDTLKEIADWLSGHASDAAAMNSQIKTNTANITALQEAMTDAEGDIEELQGDIETASGERETLKAQFVSLATPVAEDGKATFHVCAAALKDGTLMLPTKLFTVEDGCLTAA